MLRLVVVFWDGIAHSSAIPALAVDVVLLVVLLVLHWPATDTVAA